MTLANCDKQTKYWVAIFFVFTTAVGIFHEFLSCAFGIALCIGFLVALKKKEIEIYVNLTSVAVFSIVAMYLISSLWAVDKGMAMVGFFKFAPILLFTVALMQKEDVSELIHEKLPLFAAVLTIISVIGMLLPYTSEFFVVSGRLAGFFQYPNSFALFLLVAELLLLARSSKKSSYALMVILLIGILLTGSRTVFILTIVANVAMVVVTKKNIKKLLVVIACGSGLAAIYVIATGDMTILDRISTISVFESSFLGRLLYFRDALPEILTHPFGLGYMGYYYSQGTFQTGVYVVRFMHNDLLQLVIDIGWVPFMLFVGAIVKTLMNKATENYNKVIIITMVLHTCLDFDFQYIAILCLFISFLEVKTGKKMRLDKTRKALVPILVVYIVANAYMGVALGAAHLNNSHLAYKMYPWHTNSAVNVMLEKKDIAEMVPMADKLMKQNEYLLIAHSVKSREAYEQGDFANVIKYKNRIFEIAPFEYEEYKEYCYMLVNGMKAYGSKGDFESAKICRDELIATKEKLENLDDRLSTWGSLIYDQPKTKLPTDLDRYIEQLEGTK